jgi:hypothetical protein
VKVFGKTSLDGVESSEEEWLKDPQGIHMDD